MQDYEIRILGDRHNHTIIEVMHLNDSNAIRAARSLAAGRRFEVWREAWSGFLGCFVHLALEAKRTRGIDHRGRN